MSNVATIGAVPDSKPNRDTDWSALPNGRKARLTGAAAGLTGADLTVLVVFAENADRAGRHDVKVGADGDGGGRDRGQLHGGAGYPADG